MGQVHICRTASISGTYLSLRTQKIVNVIKKDCKFVIEKFSGLMLGSGELSRVSIVLHIAQYAVHEVVLCFSLSQVRAGLHASIKGP
jgi:hypothetical protein